MYASTVLIAFSIEGIFCLSKASFFKSEVYATIISGFAIISFADLKIGASASDKCDLEFLFSPSSTLPGTWLPKIPPIANTGYIQKCGTTGINRKYLGYALPVNLQHLRCKTI